MFVDRLFTVELFQVHFVESLVVQALEQVVIVVSQELTLWLIDFYAGIARGIGYAWSLKQLNPFPKTEKKKRHSVSFLHLYSLPVELMRWVCRETVAICSTLTASIGQE